MGLKVWLPLISGFINLGISNTEILSNQCTEDNNGKIGKCMSFNGSNSYIKLMTPPFNNDSTEFSYAAWVYPLNTNIGCLLSNRDASNSTGFCVFINNGGKITFDYGTRLSHTYTVPANTWTHIACVWKKGGARKIYINGTEVAGVETNTSVPTHATTTYAFIGASQNTPTSVNTNYFNGKLNDIRIYDHCLSATEVREISLGLVVHYKLDDMSGKNCVLNSDLSGTITLATDGNGYTNYEWMLDPSIKASGILLKGTPITVKYDYTATTVSGTSAYCYSQFNRSRLLPVLSMTDMRTSSSGSVTENFYCSLAQAEYASSYRIRFRFYGKATESLTIYNVLVYIGDHNAIGIIKDSSGYNYNGTAVGILTTDSDTPRYFSSASFNGIDTAINCGNDFHIQKASEITFSCWAYANNWNDGVYKYYLSSQQTGGILLVSMNSNTIRARVHAYTASDFSTYGYILADCAQANTGITTGWHMLTGVYTTTNIKLYIDGELKVNNPITTYGLHFHNTACMFIGAESNGQTPTGFLNGKISDVRIYYTALSDNDIKLLYEVSAKIDNKNNIHSFELNENGQNKITKSGLLQCSTFTEFNGMSFLKYDPNLYIESDGSCWVRIFHHNDPVNNGLFSSSDTFTTSVYKDAHRWFNVEVCNNVTTWELMIKEKSLVTDDEIKYRWIQTANPMIAAYGEVDAADIIVNTSAEYTDMTFGGIWKKYGSGTNNILTYLTQNTNSNGNWYSIGGWRYNTSGNASTGIPSFEKLIIKTGYVDLYLRIDNVTFTSSTVKSTKNNIWTGNQIIEL